MAMRMAGILGLGSLLVMGALGCGKISGDHSAVVASVGGEKITQTAFEKIVHTVVGDEAKVKEILGTEPGKEQRNAILEQVVTQKALMAFAKSEGLDKDPKVQLAVEAAVANVYATTLIERRTAAGEPTEAQLKGLYDDFVKQSEAAGQKGAVPPFEQVKAQLPALWKRKQGQQASDTLLTQLKQKYPVVFAPEYRPAQGRF